MGLRVTWERPHKHNWRQGSTSGYAINHAYPRRFREVVRWTCGGCTAVREVATEEPIGGAGDE